MIEIKKVTGRLVTYPKTKPAQTPNKAIPTDQHNIAGIVLPK